MVVILMTLASRIVIKVPLAKVLMPGVSLKNKHTLMYNFL